MFKSEHIIHYLLIFIFGMIMNHISKVYSIDMFTTLMFSLFVIIFLTIFFHYLERIIKNLEDKK